MAEGYLKAENIKGIEVISRGLAADGSAVSEKSVLAMKELGIDISEHISRQLTFADIDEATLLICMSSSHADLLEGCGVDKMNIFVLGIPDPFGGTETDYRACRDQIISGINELLEDGII